MPQISIIVPIYNSETTIKRCVDSILNQNYTDFECILVDDGSTDDTSYIIDSYTHVDKRIKTIHKRNGGVSSARNMGLANATGEWIVFIDSDDYINPSHLTNLINESENTDLLVCGFVDIKKNEKRTHSHINSKYNSQEQIKDFLCKTDFLEYMIPWDKMFKHSVIKDNKLSFDENLSLSEDRLFCYNYLLHTNAITTIGQTTYIHDNVDSNSLSNKIPPVEMQAYRYKTILHVSNKIILSYSIPYISGCFLFKYNENLLDLLLHSSKRIFEITKNIFMAIYVDPKTFVHYIHNKLRLKCKHK